MPITEAVEGTAQLAFTVTDVSGVGQAILYYSVDGGEESSLTPAVQGDIYTFTIPTQHAGSCVTYRLETADQVTPANVGDAGPWSYYCGRMLLYDDGDADYFYAFDYHESIGVRFTPDAPGKLAGLLFGFYRDTSHGLDSVDVRVWSGEGGAPGTQLFPSKAIYPINTLETPHAWTFVDLRDRDFTLDGDFIGGCTFRSVYPVILGDGTTTTSRSWVDQGSWANASDDFYIRALVGDFPTGVASAPVTLPVRFELAQPYPNPFNSTCSILIQVPVERSAGVVVYDLLGRQVARLGRGPFGPGVHRALWDGRSSMGNPVASGFYIIRLEANGTNLARKVVLVR